MADMGKTQKHERKHKSNQRISKHIERVSDLSLHFKFVFTEQKIFYKLCYGQRLYTLKLL